LALSPLHWMVARKISSVYIEAYMLSEYELAMFNRLSICTV
jgi:hypothetical protein